jgi:hypothetical protein
MGMVQGLPHCLLLPLHCRVALFQAMQVPAARQTSPPSTSSRHSGERLFLSSFASYTFTVTPLATSFHSPVPRGDTTKRNSTVVGCTAAKETLRSATESGGGDDDGHSPSAVSALSLLGLLLHFSLLCLTCAACGVMAGLSAVPAAGPPLSQFNMFLVSGVRGF